MALQGSGAISISQINTEKGNVSTLANSSLTTLSTTSINSYSNSKPNGSTPHSMSEFYSYRQDTPAITNISASADVANNRFYVTWNYTYLGANTRQDLQWSIGGGGATTVTNVGSGTAITNHGYTLVSSSTGSSTFYVNVYFYNTSTGATVGTQGTSVIFYYDTGGGGGGDQ